MKALKKYSVFIQGFLLLNLIWLLTSLVVKTNVIPNPIDVYKNFDVILSDGIALHILASLKRIGIGLLLSVFVGMLIGGLMAYSKKWNRVLHPLVYFSYPIPKTAFLPVAMILFGMRDGSKVLIMFLIMVFQVIIAVRDGILAIDKTFYQVAISAGASKGQILRHITLPAILPDMLTSVRVSLGTALSVLFFVEGYGTKFGMGYYILNAWSRINYIEMYGGIVVISIIGCLLFLIVDVFSEVICKWKW